MLKNKILSTGIILLFTITISYAAQIEGLWQANRSNDVVEIRSTYDGIKAKFLNENDWTFYESIKKNIYEDRKGNRYYVKTRDRISWESRDGRRVINLEKTRDNYREDYRERSGRNDNNYDRRDRDVHVCSSSCGASCSYRNNFDNGISGTWTNRWKNTIAYVEYDGYALRMKTNKGRKWTTYHKTNARKLKFEDRYGNRIKIKNNGELEWKRSDGRRKIDFRKRY